MKKTLLKEILDDSKKNKKLLSFKIYSEEGFYCGYVSSYTDSLVNITHYTKYGKCDGIKIIRIEDIQSIDYENDYSFIMEYTIANSEKINNITPVKIKLPKSENWIYEILKEYVNSEDHIIQIEVGTSDDDSFMGFVMKLDQEFILLRVVSNYGLDEGPTLYKLEDITSIRINDSYSVRAMLLYHWRKSNNK